MSFTNIFEKQSNIFDHLIVVEIIEQLQNGVRPWRMPWVKATEMVIIGSLPCPLKRWPSNVRAPSQPYGIQNGLILLLEAAKHGYRSNLWINEPSREQIDARLISPNTQPTRLNALNPKSRMVYNIDQIYNPETTLGLRFDTMSNSLMKWHYESSKELFDNFKERNSLTIENADKAAFFSLRTRLRCRPSGNLSKHKKTTYLEKRITGRRCGTK